MRYCKTRDGRKFELRYDTIIGRKCREQANFDFAGVEENDSEFKRACEDIFLSVDLLKIFLADQLAEAEMSGEDFERQMDFDTIDMARMEMFKAYADWLPEDVARPLIKVMEKYQKARQQGLEMLKRRFDNPAVDKMLEEELERQEQKIEQDLDKILGPKNVV